MFDKMSVENGGDALSRQREAEEKLKGGRWMGEPLSLHFLYFVFVFLAFCICICKREAEEKLKGGRWMAEPVCNVSKKEVAEKGRHFLV